MVKQIEMNDGYKITANLFVPDSSKAIVIIGSALGVGQYFYFALANYLSNKNYLVLTYDYRGTAESAPKKLDKNFEAGFQQLGLDFECIYLWIHEKYPHLPIHILGHSLGGIIPILSKKVSLYKSVFLVGAQTAYYRDFGCSKIGFLKTYCMWHILMPFLTAIYGYFPGRKLNLRIENIPKKLLSDIQQRRKYTEALDFLKGIGVESYPLGLKCPVYAITSTDDPICTPNAMRRLLKDFVHAPVTEELFDSKIHNLPKLGHAGFFRKKFETSLWHKVDEWFEKAV
ncbi:MAG: alpha/beta hydrolase family protein [Leadbetterella sp.]